jgi:(S)-mandelate dehydrogenase
VAFLQTSDHERAARRKLPRAIFDFIKGGAGSEAAQRRNESAFSGVALVPRVLRAPRIRSSVTRLLGVDYAVPFGVSPMGLGNLAWQGTDRSLITTAAGRNLPYALSAAGSTTVEEAAELANGMLWFQLYIGADFRISQSLMQRAETAGVRNLVLTVDAAHPGLRLRDTRNGFAEPLWWSPKLLFDYALHPAWSLSTLLRGLPQMVNLSQNDFQLNGPEATRVFMASMMQAALDWEMLAKVRELWPHQLIVKGVLAAEDAIQLRRAGVDALVVSNHGGRQFGSAASPLDVLPAIRTAVGPDYPLIMESGVRSGEDVIKSIVLGADFVLIGRPWLFASVAAGPQRGGQLLAELLENEVDNSMAQLGCDRIESLRYIEVVRVPG